MERRKSYFAAWHLPVVVLAVLTIAFFSFAVGHYSRAVGEPTVTIAMDNTALAIGTTSGVTFNFSAPPVGFDDNDIDLTDANGTLTSVAFTPDPSRFTATFTPNAGVNDLTNTIQIGVQWTDPLGVAPLAVSIGPNFSVSTAPPGGSSGCPAPSVTLAGPTAGSTFVVGESVDIFWTVNGCQIDSLRLILSTDGGQSFTEPVATSAAPFSGHYLWTVPALDTVAAQLRAVLLGQGGTELAADESDGAFVIQSSSGSSGGTTSTASTSPTASPQPEPTPPTSPATTDATPPPEPVTDQPATASEAMPPSSTDGATPPATETSPPADTTQSPPASPTATPPDERQTFPGPMAPPMPNIPTPLAVTTSDSDIPTTPTDTPMAALSQNNPTTGTTASTVSFDSVRGAVETATGFVPSSFDPLLSFALGVITTLGVTLGTQAAIKRRRVKSTKRCLRCLGTGEEPPEKKGMAKCDACDGAGKIEEDEEQNAECKHCAGEGEDPCHTCKGSGKDAAGQACPACKGGGKTLTGKQDKDGEDEVAACEICRGEGEVSVTVKKMVPCQKCGGTGKI